MQDLGLNDGCNTSSSFICNFSETGIIGFLLFLSIFYLSPIICLYYLRLIIKFFKNKDKVIYFSLVAIFISMFPLLPSGNYFNNWYIINYLPIGFYLANKLKI